MIMDIHSVEIMTGDIVRIDNAYFKTDNGLYFVSDKEGDPSTCGTGLTLRKVCRNGEVSTTKHNIAFWPLMHFCNDRTKRALADDWDEANATIEIVNKNVSVAGVVKWFRDEADKLATALEHWKWDGRHAHNYVVSAKIRKHYLAVADRLEKEVA